MMPVSLDCPFLIASSVFSKVSLLLFVLSWVPNDASVFGLSILIASSVFSNVSLSCVLCTLCSQCLWIVYS